MIVERMVDGLVGRRSLVLHRNKYIARPLSIPAQPSYKHPQDQALKLHFPFTISSSTQPFIFNIYKPVRASDECCLAGTYGQGQLESVP